LVTAQKNLASQSRIAVCDRLNHQEDLMNKSLPLFVGAAALLSLPCTFVSAHAADDASGKLYLAQNMGQPGGGRTGASGATGPGESEAGADSANATDGTTGSSSSSSKPKHHHKSSSTTGEGSSMNSSSSNGSGESNGVSSSSYRGGAAGDAGGSAGGAGAGANVGAGTSGSAGSNSSR
jgi:hypothetical protein